MSKSDGGPAFPLYEKGMTLRDYFAAKALQVAIATSLDSYHAPAALAKKSYKIADAMIAEREKSSKEAL